MSTPGCCFGRCSSTGRPRPHDSLQHAPLRHGRETVFTRRDAGGRTVVAERHVADFDHAGPNSSKISSCASRPRRISGRGRPDSRHHQGEMSAIRDHPGARLTAHFFRGLFDLGFLSETATASFTQLVIGVCAAFIAFGLLLTRAYGAKPSRCPRCPDRPVSPRRRRRSHLPHRAADVGRRVRHCARRALLFPDETDFRVLSPLPITRRLVFGARPWPCWVRRYSPASCTSRSRRCS
jgi:hypothetical protein